jgi:hypothetical protein
MPSRRPAVVIFACPTCRQGTRPLRSGTRPKPGRFDCIKCNAEIHAWTGFYYQQKRSCCGCFPPSGRGRPSHQRAQVGGTRARLALPF